MVQTLLFIYIVFLIFLGYMLFRNFVVWKVRMMLLNKVSDMAQKDIEEGLEWRWRYEHFESVTYDQMFLHFWKPLKIKYWYPDKSFILPQKKKK